MRVFESQHTGDKIDTNISLVDKLVKDVEGLSNLISSKADKKDIPTSIEDLLKDPSLTWIGEDPPTESLYKIWVRILQNRTPKIYVKNSQTSEWIDTTHKDTMFIELDFINEYSVEELCKNILELGKQIVIFDYLNQVMLYPIWVSAACEEIIFSSGIVESDFENKVANEMKIYYLKGVVNENGDTWSKKSTLLEDKPEILYVGLSSRNNKFVSDKNYQDIYDWLTSNPNNTVVVSYDSASEWRTSMYYLHDWESDCMTFMEMGEKGISVLKYINPDGQFKDAYWEESYCPHGGGSSEPSDWNQNDPTKADYIKNRPFYKEDVTIDVVSAEDIGIVQRDADLGLIIYRHANFNIQDDTEYDVEYDVELVDVSDNIHTYNATLIYDESSEMWMLDCGEFAIYDYEGFLATTDNIFFQKLTIYKKYTIYHTIPQEYLNLTDIKSGVDLFVVNITTSEAGVITANKTFQQIIDAYNLNKIVKLRGVLNGVMWDAPLIGITDNFVMFVATRDNQTVSVNCSSTDIWTAQLIDLATKEYVDNAVSNIGGGGTSTNNIADAEIGNTTTWSSQKIVKEIFNTPLDFKWELGSISSSAGADIRSTTRVRTDYIDVYHPYMLIEPKPETKLYVYFFGDESSSTYVGNSGGWITSPIILSDMIPDDTRFIRLVIGSINDEEIIDVDAISKPDVYTMLGVYSEYKPDVPENIGVLNAILNFKQLAEVKYHIKENLPVNDNSYKQQSYLPKGEVYTGLPYSSSRPEAGFVPNFVSMYTFMTALQNPKSYLYTVNLGAQGNKNGNTYYGAVCSTSCGYALGIIPNYSTHQWGDVPGMERLEWQSVYALKLGDTICGNGHVVMVTDITRNKRGKIGKITITEAAPPLVKSTKYTPEQLEAVYPYDDYTYYRYNEIHKVKHIQSPFVAVEDEVPQEVVYNTSIIPRKGDKSNWLEGIPIEIDILEKDDYTHVEIYKDENLYNKFSIDGETEDVDRTVYGISWGHGYYYSATGKVSKGTTRIYTLGLIPSTDLIINFTDTLKVAVVYYAEDGTYIKGSSTGWKTDNVINVADFAPENALLCGINVAYTDDSEITDIQTVGDLISIQSTANDQIPIMFSAGTLSSADGSELSGNARLRSGFIPINNNNLQVASDYPLVYNIHFYDQNKQFISRSNDGWLSDTINIRSVAPDGSAFMRIIATSPLGDEEGGYSHSPGANSSVGLERQGIDSLRFHMTFVNTENNIVIDNDTLVLTDISYGSYKARLIGDLKTSDWCYWIVVDATSDVTPTGNLGEVSVDFSASNATPLFVSWSDGGHNGTVHISVPTAEEISNGNAICSYQAGNYKVRVAFQTEYGIVHSTLSSAMDV